VGLDGPIMVELPSNFSTAVATSASQQIANFDGILVLVVGLLLSLLAVGALIKMFR